MVPPTKSVSAQNLVETWTCSGKYGCGHVGNHYKYRYCAGRGASNTNGVWTTGAPAAPVSYTTRARAPAGQQPGASRAVRFEPPWVSEQARKLQAQVKNLQGKLKKTSTAAEACSDDDDGAPEVPAQRRQAA